MTSPVDDVWQGIHGQTIQLASTYLRNIVRGPGTCAVCATPVDGYLVCAPCNYARRGAYGDELADRVGAVAYAMDNHQSGTLMYGYKQKGQPQQLHIQIMELLFADALVRHTDCAGTLAGFPVTSWTLVPSLNHQGRSDAALPGIVQPFMVNLPRAEVTAVRKGKGKREVEVGLFRVDSDLRGHHLLIIDDTWVSGSQAQSLAVEARRAGAVQVSILTIGRWLDMSWSTSREWWKAQPRVIDFQPGVCPYTAGACP